MRTDPPPELTITAWLRFGAIRRSLRSVQPERILEVGVGGGALGSWLARRYDYTGVEPDDRSRSLAAKRLAVLDRAVVHCELDDVAGEPFDVVCAFEVLEHIEDDGAALASWRARVVPHGHILLSVPAHSRSYGPSDEFVGHFRRYDRVQLCDLLATEGFETVSWCTYGAGLGHAIDAVRNRILGRRTALPTAEERSGRSGRLFQPGGRVRAYINYLVALPFRVVQTPFAQSEVGIGYVVLARRRVDAGDITRA